MKRLVFLLSIGFIFAVPAMAEDTAATAPATDAAPTAPATPAPPTPPAPAVVENPVVPAPVAETVKMEAVAAIPAAENTAPGETVNTENLEFVSGEVSALDEASKALTVKLYGESENTPSDKTLKVNVDANTDITDGEQDRDLKSLTAGTEVDVEYDPATNKATYIFVY